MKKLLLATVSAVVLSTMPSYGAATSEQENIRIKWGRNLSDSLALAVHGSRSDIRDKVEIAEQHRNTLIRTFVDYIVLSSPVRPMERLVDIHPSLIERWKKFNEKQHLSNDELNYCRDLLMGTSIRLRSQDAETRRLDLQNHIFPCFLINSNMSLNKDEMYQMLTHETGWLRKLALSNSNNGEFDGLIEALPHPNCKLTSLEISALYNKNINIIAFVEALQKSNLTTLFYVFSNCEFVKAIAAVLPNSQLTSLRISCGDEGVKAIAAALPESKLITLNLSCRDLKEDAVNLIAEALRNPNCKLEKIILVSNITDAMKEKLTSEFPHIDFDCKLWR